MSESVLMYRLSNGFTGNVAPVSGFLGMKHSGIYSLLRPDRSASIHWLNASSKASNASILRSKILCPLLSHFPDSKNISGTASIYSPRCLISPSLPSWYVENAKFCKFLVSSSASSGTSLSSQVSLYLIYP